MGDKNQLPTAYKVQCCLNCKHMRSIVAYSWENRHCACYAGQEKTLSQEELLAQDRIRDGGLMVCSLWRPKD